MVGDGDAREGIEFHPVSGLIGTTSQNRKSPASCPSEVVSVLGLKCLVM